MLDRVRDELVAGGFKEKKATAAVHEVIASASAEVHDRLVVRFTAEKMKDGASPAANVTEYMLEFAEKHYDHELAPELVTFFEKKLTEGTYDEKVRPRVKAALEATRQKMKPLLLEHLRVQARNEQRLLETDNEEEKGAVREDLETLQKTLVASYTSVAETPEVLDASRPAAERLATQLERSGAPPTAGDQVLIAAWQREEQQKQREEQQRQREEQQRQREEQQRQENKKRAAAHAELHGLSVQFKPGSAELSNSARVAVNRAARLLKEAPDFHLEIHGHADATGRWMTNRTLSLRRARSVVKALAAEGVAQARLGSCGFGESKPKAENATSAGRAENRRVELYVVGPFGQPVAPTVGGPAQAAPAPTKSSPDDAKSPDDRSARTGVTTGRATGREDRTHGTSAFSKSARAPANSRLRNGIEPSVTLGPRASRGTRPPDSDYLIKQIKPWLGVPYKWGCKKRENGCIDNSGFVRSLFRDAFAVDLPVSSQLQAMDGRRVKKSQLRTGDLLFFGFPQAGRITHVAVYVGSGIIAHATSSRGVTYAKLASPYWGTHYKRARRYL